MEVEPSALPKITGSKATKRRERQGYIPLVVLPSGQTVTGRDSGGTCLYLDDGGLCELHAELGAEHKPLACQLYPYSITATPDGYFTSLSFACPVVLWGHEGDLEGNRRELEVLLKSRGQKDGPLPHQVELIAGRFIPWSSYRALEANLEKKIDRGSPALSLLGTVGSILTILSQTADNELPGWEALRAAPPEDEFEEKLLEMVCASLIALLELPENPERRQEMSLSLQAGVPLVAPRHGVPLASFSLRSEFDEVMFRCLNRYLANAFFGKSLLVGTLVSRLLTLAAGVGLIVYYGRALEAVSSREEAVSRAFELVEAELLTHSHSMTPLFVSLEETFCQAYGISEDQS